MKRWNELKDQELAALGETEIQFFIDVELARKEIIPVKPPVKVENTAPELVRDDTYFEVSGLLFKNKDDAIKVAAMTIYKEDYDYGGYDYKFAREIGISSKGPVTTLLFYKEDIQKHRELIQTNGEKKESYTAEKQAYDLFAEESTDIRAGIWAAVRDARAKMGKIADAKETFERYLELADGDEAVAIKFFKKTYAEYEDTIALVLGNNRLTADIVGEVIKDAAK